MGESDQLKTDSSWLAHSDMNQRKQIGLMNPKQDPEWDQFRILDETVEILSGGDSGCGSGVGLLPSTARAAAKNDKISYN
jgi:hypothetical protein